MVKRMANRPPSSYQTYCEESTQRQTHQGLDFSSLTPLNDNVTVYVFQRSFLIVRVKD